MLDGFMVVISLRYDYFAYGHYPTGLPVLGEQSNQKPTCHRTELLVERTGRHLHVIRTAVVRRCTIDCITEMSMRFIPCFL